jgi:signal transduction histidine kinase
VLDGRVHSGSALLKQSRSIRFKDTDTERRFRLEQRDAVMNRTRGLVLVAVMVIAGLGLQEMEALRAAGLPEMVEHSFRHRFGGAIPIYLMMLAATFLPGAQRRLDLILGLCVTGVIWSFALLRWHGSFHFEPKAIASMVLLDSVVTLVISVVALPLLFRGVVGMAVISIGGIVVLFSSTVWRGEPFLAAQFAGSAVGLVSFAVILQWFRERYERRGFAQRESMAGLNRELSRLNREKNEFMTIAAHDLRSPLSIVKTYSEMLEADSMSLQDRKVAFRQIREQADCMLNLVDNYLGAHALETGSVRVKRQPIDLYEIARKLQRVQMPRAQIKGQMITLTKADAPVWVQSDSALLAQIGENYLGNALKFSPEGAEVNLTVVHMADTDRARLTVRDHGPGIPAAEHDRVFRKFGRTSVHPTGGETSHGLGLALVKVLAGRLGAVTGFESKAGQGSAFWVELEAVPAPAEPDGRPAAPVVGVN